jgi:iron complex transport system permease protein
MVVVEAGPAPTRSMPAALTLRVIALLLSTVALGVVAVLSLRIGSLGISNADAWNALFNYSPSSYEETVVRSLRLPRTLIGLGVGAALAVAGAVMQAATRNPLAGPETLGVNNGAAFGIATAVFFGQLTQPQHFIWFGFAGGLAAATIVYAIGSAGAGGASPVKLALSGVIVSALLSSWLTALLLLDQQTLDVVRFWLAGSLAGRDTTTFLIVLPFLVLGTVGVLLLSHQLNILSLGDDTARGLGMNTGRMRLLLAVLVVLLTGASVAVAGPISFVGLAVPHIVRVVAGPDYRWVLAFCIVVGPTLLLTADILGRIVARPSEIQVGIITALLGAPFLIGLARQRKVAEL